jgi:hypothetical protein
MSSSSPSVVHNGRADAETPQSSLYGSGVPPRDQERAPRAVPGPSGGSFPSLSDLLREIEVLRANDQQRYSQMTLLLQEVRNSARPSGSAGPPSGGGLLTTGSKPVVSVPPCSAADVLSAVEQALSADPKASLQHLIDSVWSRLPHGALGDTPRLFELNTSDPTVVNLGQKYGQGAVHEYKHSFPVVSYFLDVLALLVSFGRQLPHPYYGPFQEMLHHLLRVYSILSQRVSHLQILAHPQQGARVASAITALARAQSGATRLADPTHNALHAELLRLQLKRETVAGASAVFEAISSVGGAPASRTPAATAVTLDDVAMDISPVPVPRKGSHHPKSTASSQPSKPRAGSAAQ